MGASVSGMKLGVAGRICGKMGVGFRVCSASREALQDNDGLVSRVTKLDDSSLDDSFSK